MLGYIRPSDTNQTGLRCPCTPHPGSYARISWLKRVQIVWPQWSLQPWHHLWIGHSRVINPYVQLEPCATTWTGLQILGRIRSWFLSPSRKGLTKTSPLPPSPHGSNKLWFCAMSSLTRRPSPCIRLKPMMLGPLLLLRPSNQGYP